MTEPRIRLPAGLTLRAPAGAAAFDGRGGAALLRLEGFAPDTPIATAEGVLPADAILPGDLIVTPDGAAVPVLRCLAHAVDAAAAARQPGLRPIRIAAGALGDGLPRQPVVLGPDQAVRVGPWQAAARLLVNGAAIAAAPPGAAGFVRLVLGVPGALAVAGLACPARAAPIDPRGAVALRVLADRLSGAAPGRLAGKIEEASAGHVVGWALDAAMPDAPVPLEVAVDGAPVAAGFAGLRRPDLEMRGLGGGACAFAIRFAPLPAARRAWLTVRRASDGADVPGSPVLLGAAPAPGAALAAIARQRAAAPAEPARNALAGALFAALDRLSAEGTAP